MKANLTGAGLIPVQHKVVRTTVTHSGPDGKKTESEVSYVDIDDDGRFGANDTVVVMDLNRDGRLDMTDAVETARMLKQRGGESVQDGQILSDQGQPLQVHLVNDRDGDGQFDSREITAAGPKLSWLGPDGAELMVVDTSGYKMGLLPTPWNGAPSPFPNLGPSLPFENWLGPRIGDLPGPRFNSSVNGNSSSL